jgi:hypothetical protein
MLESPLGRLVLERKLDRVIFDAGMAWGKFFRTWRACKGIPMEARKSDGGPAFKWPEPETMQRWNERVEKIENAAWFKNGLFCVTQTIGSCRPVRAVLTRR